MVYGVVKGWTKLEGDREVPSEKTPVIGEVLRMVYAESGIKKEGARIVLRGSEKKISIEFTDDEFDKLLTMLNRAKARWIK